MWSGKETLKPKKKIERKKRGGSSRAARGSAHVCCPTCGGTGKLPKESVKVTRYQWNAKGAKKVKRDKLLTSFLTITTVSAPNEKLCRAAGGEGGAQQQESK